MQHLSYEECREIERTHICGVCKQPLVTIWDGEANSYAIKCGLDPSHEGFERLLSYTQARKAGMQLPMEIEQTFQRKESAKMQDKKGIGTPEITSLIPLNDAGSGSALAPEQRKLIIAVATRVELDPYLSHVVLFYGRPYITEAGMLYHAHRTGELDGISTRPLTKKERESYQIPDDEHAWLAEVWKQGQGHPFTGLGRARGDEKRPIARGSAVEPQHPQRMAEKRAEMQALRKAFPIGLPILGEEEETEEVQE